MEQRDFLGDEVHMMQNDIKALRTENTLLKLKCERQDQEITGLREENAGLKSSCEQRTIDLASLRAVLENVGQVITHGLERYANRRTLKQETTQINSAPPDWKQDQTETSRIAPKNETDGDHPLLPRVGLSDEETDELIRKMNDDLGQAANGESR